MKAFTYERAKDAESAARAVAGHAGAKFIAGGTNLLDLMKLEIEAPSHLVDVQDLKLDRIEPTPEGGLRIGALVRNTDLAADKRVRRDYAVLSRALLAGASICSFIRSSRLVPPAMNFEFAMRAAAAAASAGVLTR